MTQDLIGRTIGNYKIEELLGAGGMGQVYRGTHARLNRPAAIKVMHSHLAADPGFRARFQQEARSAAGLDHPNIVQIYEFDERDGEFFLVMEFIANGSLRGMLRDRGGGQSTGSLYDGLDLIRQAAEGLTYAHAQGMVHRDIKPDNLLLKQVENPATGRRSFVVKISDFGLARLIESAAMTVSGAPMGTPAYMSPEQAQGHELDGRADIYSLGVVLYELSTGYLPFETRTLSDAVYKHVFVSPSSPCELNPDLPQELETVILRCLEKQPDDRYSGAAELAEAIRDVQHGLNPVTQIPDQRVQGPEEQQTRREPLSGEPPEAFPPLPGSASNPRIQILSQDGATHQVVHLPNDGLNVGRIQGNDLVLPDESVSRRHLRIERDQDRISVVDLGSWNGTLVGGHRLLPQVQQTWEADDLIQIGSFWLRLALPGQDSDSFSDRRNVTPPRTQTDTPDPDRIRVILDEEEITVTPDKPAAVQGRLANLGSTVDHIRITVEGVPDAWVQFSENDIQLNPGDQAEFTLTLNVPRSAENRAGRYRVKVHAQSGVNESESSTALAVWDVLPFAESRLSLHPSHGSGRTQAKFTIGLENRGNASTRFSLQASDDREELRYRFASEQVEVSPADAASVPLTVRASRRWFRGGPPRMFTVESIPGRGDAQSVTGQFEQKATFPLLLIPVLAIVALGAAFLLIDLPGGQVNAPSIERFTVEPSALNQGDQVTISWEVTNADEVAIEVPTGELFGNLPPQGQTLDSPGQSGDYTLRATNADGDSSESRSVEIGEVEVETPTPPATPDDILQISVNDLALDSAEFELSMENTSDDHTIEVSVFSLSVVDDVGNQYQFDRFAMDQGLQATIPAGQQVNVDYVLTEPIVPDASVVTFVLSDIFAQRDGDTSTTRLSPIRVEVNPQ